MHLKTFGITAIATLALIAPVSRAELITGLIKNNFQSAAGIALVTFDSQTPETTTAPIAITGAPNLRAIDYRPANGLLYGFGYTPATRSGQLYTINALTGVALPVGGSIAFASFDDSPFLSIDFNPAVDRLRVVTEMGSNYRVNPNDGTFIADTRLSLNGDAPFISDIAYSNNLSGAASTTLYALDYYADALETIGSVGGNPVSPNSGQVFTVGGFGGPIQYGADNGFDISSTTGIGYVTFDRFGPFEENDEFFQVDLTTGELTQIGGDDMLPDLLDISINVVPEPTSFSALALLGLATLRRRR